MGQSVYVGADGAAIGAAPSGVCLHQRAVVTNTAGALGSFITAIGQADNGIPYYTSVIDGQDLRHYPKAVVLQQERGQTGVVYITYDGHDTSLGDVSATLGMECVPTASGYVRIPVSCDPYAGANGTGLIRLVTSVGTINVQCAFEF